MIAELFLATAMQVVPIARPTDSVVWDYPDSALTAGAVTSFNACLDTSPCVKVDPATSKGTVAGTYKWKLPALTVGSHAVTISACNADLCTDAPILTFRMVVVPGSPGNVRLGGGN